MAKVIKNFNVGNRSILILDKIENDFNEIEINGITYKADIVYEMENAISIIGTSDFLGKMVLLK